MIDHHLIKAPTVMYNTVSMDSVCYYIVGLYFYVRWDIRSFET